MSAARWSRDLQATVVVALMGLILAFLGGDGWLKAVLLLPMVLVLPGYALTAAFFPPGSIPAAERAVYTVMLSIAVTGVGGMLVEVFVGLEPRSWAALLFLATLSASWLAQRRRRHGASEPASTQIEVGRLNPLSLLLLAAAVGLAAVSLSTAIGDAREGRDDAHFVGLWALPHKSPGTGGAGAVSIGVLNHEGRPVSFRLRVTREGNTLVNRPLRLGRGREWSMLLRVSPAPAPSPLLVTLLRGGAVYRQAFLRSEPEP
jgi:uncharacterized membrane protein